MTFEHQASGEIATGSIEIDSRVMAAVELALQNIMIDTEKIYSSFPAIAKLSSGTPAQDVLMIHKQAARALTLLFPDNGTYKELNNQYLPEGGDLLAPVAEYDNFSPAQWSAMEAAYAENYMSEHSADQLENHRANSRAAVLNWVKNNRPDLLAVAE